MRIEPLHAYHVFNRGNNKQKIFFKDGDYVLFLKNIRKHLLPCCDIMAYCLMPNHFHLLIHTDERSVQVEKPTANIPLTALSRAVKMLLSSYTKAINKEQSRTGSLFQQNTKCKWASENKPIDSTAPMISGLSYLETCFHYIHQNPVKAGLVERMEDWQYSSFADYTGLRNGTIPAKELAIKLMGLNPGNLAERMASLPLIEDIG